MIEENHDIRKHMKESENPYKALDAYEERDQGDFYGREEAAEELCRRVRLNRLTVVYGGSGLGKTSLLNAGLFPRLRREKFLPVPIRLNFVQGAPTLKEQICNAIISALSLSEVDEKEFRFELKTQIPELHPVSLSQNETLWEYFRRVKHIGVPGIYESEKNEEISIIPVLVFDQFEEIFTVGEKHPERAEMLNELYWLIEDQLPPVVKEQIGDKLIRAKKIAYSSVNSQFRVIFSLREDYLPALYDMRGTIPSIDRSQFRVSGLNLEQARDIVSKPQNGINDIKTEQSIIEYFESKGLAQEDNEIFVEPAFLSLICYQVVDEGLTGIISESRLDEMLEGYYDSIMGGEPGKVHQFVESRLLTESGFRTPYLFEKDDPSIADLENKRILRVFQGTGSNKYVEIVHDFLAATIKKRRDLRLRKKRARTILFLCCISVGLLFLSLFSLYQWNAANDERASAKHQSKVAEARRLTAQALMESNTDNTKAIRIAEAAVDNSTPGTYPSAMQALSQIGYSAYKKPFYIAEFPLANDDIIYDTEFSAKDDRILTAHHDGITRVWDLEGKELFALQRQPGRIESTAFSKHGLIATACWDKTVRIWDRRGKLLRKMEHDGAVLDVCFSPDGKYVLSASLDGTARLWDLEGNELQVFEHEGRVTSGTFSPDNRYILTASWDRTAKLWEWDGRLKANLKKHTDTLTSAVFAPKNQDIKNQYILTGAWDNTAILWDYNGKVIKTYEYDSVPLFTLFFPDGKSFVIATQDGTIDIWKIGSKKPAATITHPGPLSTISISPKGTFIIAAYESGTVKLWDTQGRERAVLKKHDQKIHSVALSRDGRYAFTSSQGERGVLWSLENEILLQLQHERAVIRAGYASDEKSVMTLSEDGEAKLWVHNGRSQATIKTDEKIIAVRVAPGKDSSSQVLTAARDCTVKQWGPKGDFIALLKKSERNKRFSRAEFSGNGGGVLFLANYQSAFFLDLTKPDLKLKELKHDETIDGAAFSRSGRHILSFSRDDGVFILWDTQAGEPSKFEQSKLTSACFSPGGKKIISTSSTGEVAIRDLAGTVLYETDIGVGEEDLKFAVLSPDGNRLLAAGSDGLVMLKDIKSGRPVSLAHQQYIYHAVFSPDSKRVLTASMDKTAKLWDTRGNLLATLDHGAGVRFAKFSPCQTKILTVDRGNAAKIWMTPRRILDWLENPGTRIPPLTDKDRRELKIPVKKDEKR